MAQQCRGVVDRVAFSFVRGANVCCVRQGRGERVSGIRSVFPDEDKQRQHRVSCASGTATGAIVGGGAVPGSCIDRLDRDPLSGDRESKHGEYNAPLAARIAGSFAIYGRT